MEQNLLLKHRVEVLEGTVANMKKEMGAVKSALGPWFHRAKTTAANAGGVTRTLGGIHLQPETSERRRSRTEDDAGLGDESGGLENGGNAASNGNGVERMMASSRLPLEDGHDARTEDSGYLPALRDFMPPPYLGALPGMHRPLGMGVGGLSALNGVNAQNHVAPLDLETNLVGALEGLRESGVGVAAGMDLLGRRIEIALAQETLKLGEEVISLRAGVHGLRMQVSKF